MLKPALAFFLLLIFIPYNSNAQSRKAKNLKKDYLESSFRMLNEMPSPLIKWEETDTVQYIFRDGLQYMSRKNWDRFTKDLESLTGLKIMEAAQPDKAQIKIHHKEIREFASIEKVTLPATDLSGFDHWSSRSYTRQYQLKKVAMCLVPARIKDDQRGSFLLQQQFLKSLGLLGKTENEYSIFYKHQTNGNRNLSKNDKRIIRIHYLPEVKAGKSWDEVSRHLDKEVDLEKLLKENV